MSSPAINRAAAEAALSDFPDPETGDNIVATGQLQNVEVLDSAVRVTLGLTTHSGPLWGETRDAVAATLRDKLPGVSDVTVDVVEFKRPPKPLGQMGLTAKSVIAVGSGKGGVGKSTIAVSLAIGLQRAGAKVALVDADVYGPSIPHLLGVNRRPEIFNGKIVPIEAAGLKVMSIGFLVAPGDPVVVRGPILHRTITQFLQDTLWGDLDYLILDMPPGTGDVALTLSQLLPLSGAVVVCTPQDVALLDAVKAIAMFRKVSIPVLGMVENMSGFVCPSCREHHDIFGKGGAEARAAELAVPFLGAVPINIQLRKLGDAGQAAANFADPQAAPYLEHICRQLVRELGAGHRSEPPLPELSIG